MDKMSNLALIAQMIDAAEKNIKSARQLLREMTGGDHGTADENRFTDKAQVLSTYEGGKIIEGVFDGQNMIGPDGKQYPVPANYASKSKLVEGDVLKLTIAEDGSFIYKQIGPIDRIKLVAHLTKDEKGDFRAIAEGKAYKVLLASITYFKAEPGNNITIIVPKDHEATWAAVENVITAGENPGDIEMTKVDAPEDHEMDEI